MQGVGHGDGVATNFLRPTLIHGTSIPDAFRFQPGARLVDAHHLGLEALGQRYGIVNVIEVPVGNADGVDSRDLETLGERRVAIGPGIHQQDLAGREAELESSMTEPRDLHKQDILLKVIQ